MSQSAKKGPGIRRVFIVVLDSAGVGFLPDAGDYGDLGANTLGHIGEAVGLSVPTMESLGLGRIRGYRFKNRLRSNPTRERIRREA